MARAAELGSEVPGFDDELENLAAVGAAVLAGGFGESSSRANCQAWPVPLARRPTTEAEAIAWLIDQVPELAALLHDRIVYNEELLSYVVFEGDFLRWFIDRARAGDHDPAERFVAAIVPVMATEVEPPANDRVWNLADVAFVEGLVMRGDVDEVIATARPWMGPNTSSDVDRMFRYRSGELPPTA